MQREAVAAETAGEVAEPAASIVAAGANEIVTLSPTSEGILGSGINELQGMMREGNQVIFASTPPATCRTSRCASTTA